jgi:hypothetical protein
VKFVLPGGAGRSPGELAAVEAAAAGEAARDDGNLAIAWELAQEEAEGEPYLTVQPSQLVRTGACLPWLLPVFSGHLVFAIVVLCNNFPFFIVT